MEKRPEEENSNFNRSISFIDRVEEKMAAGKFLLNGEREREEKMAKLLFTYLLLSKNLHPSKEETRNLNFGQGAGSSVGRLPRR